MSPAPLSNRTLSLLAASGLTFLATGSAAAAPHDPMPPKVTASVSETVQVVMDADAKIAAQRMYTQVSATGAGHLDLAVPSPNHLRDLNGFSAPHVKDGQARYQLSVRGQARHRTLADYDKTLPVKVRVDYLLDGKKVHAGDVVGKSGTLEVRYHIENTTSATRAVTYTGPDGKPVTEHVRTPIPLVGTLAMTLPDRFTQITAPDAAVSGDGRGGNQLLWSLVLFAPIGSTTAEVGYKTQITDGEVPAAKLQLAVVAPKDNAATRSAGEQYKAGAASGADLTTGASTIDQNLRKLQAGAGQLLTGMEQMKTGAGELSSGLNDKAVPGAKKVATGASSLATGLRGQAVPGSKKVAAGASKLKAGADTLSAGLDTLYGGMHQLDAQLPDAVTGLKKVLAGVNQITAGLGDESNPATLIGGAHALATGLPDAKSGTAQAKGGVDAVKAGLDDALKPGGDIDQLAAGVTSLNGYCDGDPVCEGTVAALTAKIGSSSDATSLRSKTAQASGGLGQVSGGLGQVASGLDDAVTGSATLEGGLKQLKAGATNPACLTGSVPDLDHCGVAEGLQVLLNSLDDAVTGVGKLTAGAQSAAGGGQRVAGGAGALSDGAGALNTGLTDAATGSAKLAAGAHDLSDGLTPAAAGSKKLAAGLAKAAPGADKLERGAGQLSSEGTQKLVAAGKSTAAQFGSKYGQIVALNERAAENQLAYGNVTVGADAQTSAFSYELAGATDGDSSNALRALGAVAALGAGVAATAAVRRRRS